MVTKPNTAYEPAADGFDLTPEEQAEIEAALDEADGGDVVDGDDYVAELRRRIGRA